ncbi:hypothetical protein [Hallerella succinigenes]|uniref:Uncharacterized protein n=1 Tax=Hallerella succinigenes TaxID=1896222 RepID=A0A2M9A5W0_9BACT|nr:hypothetical protein [Hallerella succinigenes]PJJ41100.1 hypothetical protein BGX16_1056 [Hallerella succinigenes]
MIHMRPFNSFEKKNIEYLVNHNIPFTQVQITATGLKKAILDATAPMRAYFKENNVHDYAIQQKGQENKVSKPTFIHTRSKVIKTTTSLYRPETKDGDPRLWIYGLKEATEANDIHAIIAFSPNELHVVNLSKEDIRCCCETDVVNPLRDLILSISDVADTISRELLGKLMKYRNEWIIAPADIFFT